MKNAKIDGESLGLSRRSVLRRFAASLVSAAAAMPFTACSSLAQVEPGRLNDLMERARALGIHVNPSQDNKAVGVTSPSTALLPLVDLVNRALDLSLTGNVEAARLSQDAGELLSQLNRVLRQPAAAEEIKKIYKFGELKADYRYKFDACEIDVARGAEVQAWADRLSNPKYRARYTALSSASGVPWYIIAVIHYRECSANFMGHLHNGDPLRSQTVDVPKDRPDPPWPPSPWDPVTAWQTSAIDALKIDGFYGQKDWTLERSLFRLEGFNGFGTRSHGVIPNYLWNFSRYPTRGGYNADGHYEPDYASSQCGAAVILKVWANKGTINFPGPTGSTRASPG